MLSTLLAVSLALPAVGDAVAWESDFDQAFQKALTRGCPVLICINMDQEWANDELANKVYREPEFVARSKTYVCLAASVFDHPSAGAPGQCSRFVGISCAAHRKIEIKARGKFIGGSVAIAPQHIIASPKGELISREAYFVGREALYEQLDSVFAADGSLLEFESLPTPKPGTAPGRGVTVGVPLLTLKELRERIPTEVQSEQFNLISDIGKLDRMTSVRMFTEVARHDGAATALKKSAIRRLGKKGSYDTLDVLLELLEHEEIGIRISAAEGLELSELPEATEPLLGLLGRRPTEQLKCTALRAVGACGGADPRVQKALKSGLRDSTDSVRCSSALGLGYAVGAILRPGSEAKPTDAKQPIRLLTRALGDKEWQVRGAAAYALGVARVDEAREELQEMFTEDRSSKVRGCAGAAIRNLDAEGETVETLADYRGIFAVDFLR